MQDCKDGSGLRFNKFVFVTGVKKSELPFLLSFDFFSRYFVSLVNISLLSSLLTNFSSYFKIIK